LSNSFARWAPALPGAEMSQQRARVRMGSKARRLVWGSAVGNESLSGSPGRWVALVSRQRRVPGGCMCCPIRLSRSPLTGRSGRCLPSGVRDESTGSRHQGSLPGRPGLVPGRWAVSWSAMMPRDPATTARSPGRDLTDQSREPTHRWCSSPVPGDHSASEHVYPPQLDVQAAWRFLTFACR